MPDARRTLYSGMVRVQHTYTRKHSVPCPRNFAESKRKQEAKDATIASVSARINFRRMFALFSRLSLLYRQKMQIQHKSVRLMHINLRQSTTTENHSRLLFERINVSGERKQFRIM